MEYRILGPLTVLSAGRELPLGALKDRTVLAVLLLHANAVVSRQRLIDELYGASPPSSAVKAVNVYMSQLRKALGGDGVGPIATRPPGYTIEVAPGALDAQRFNALTAEARVHAEAGDFAAATDLYGSALGLWRGRALAGIELESLGRHEVERLEETRIAAVMDRIDCELALGRHGGAVGELEVLLAEHPLRERLYAQQMLALYRSGRQTDALHTFKRARSLLVEELGLEPSPALQRLERGILNHDPSLQASGGTARRNGAHPPEANESPTPQRPRRSVRRLVLAGGAVLAAAGAALVVASHSSRPALPAGDAVLLVDQGNHHVTGRIPLASPPTDAVSDGRRMWLLSAAGTLTAVSPSDSSASTLELGGSLAGLAAGDDAIWVADQDSGSVIRVDAATGTTVDRIRVGNGPDAVAFGAGSAWVANAADGTVSRIDGRRERVTATIPAGASPAALTFGAGSLWVADEQSGTVTRIDAQSNRPVAVIQVGSAPKALAFGGASVWVGDAQGGGVSRIHVATNSVISTIAVGTSVDALTFVGGRVWVGSSGWDGVRRVDPREGRLGRPIAFAGSVVGFGRLGQRLAVAAGAPATGHRGGTLVLAGAADVPTFDPATWYTVDGFMALAATNDGLVTLRRAGGTAGFLIVPDLARTLPLVDASRTTYTFVLRPNLRYSTGRPVQAGDVRASFERAWRLAGQWFVQYSDLRLGLVGERRCLSTPKRCDLSRAIDGDDRAGTVTFHLERPNPSFLRQLTMPFFDLLPAGTPARDRRILPATGPYRIASYLPGRRIVFVRNRWFRPRPGRLDGYVDRIVWRLVNDRRAKREVLAGRADFLVQGHLLTPAEVRQLALHRAGQLHPTRSLPWSSHLFLNTHLPPFNRVEARRALNEAINRRAVVAAAGGNLGARSTCQILPAGYPGYRPYCPYTIGANASGMWTAPDLPAARRDVQRSHTAGMKVTVWARVDPDDSIPLVDVHLARYLASVLRSLGYRADVATVHGWDAYNAKISDPATHVQAGIAGWIADYPGNAAIIPPTLSCDAPAAGNQGQFCDPTVDREAQRAAGLEGVDPAAASRAWARVDRRIVDEAPWVPLVEWRTWSLVSKRLGNYTDAPQSGFLLDRAWVR